MILSDLSDRGIDEACVKRVRSRGYVCCSAEDFVNEALTVLRARGFSITAPASQPKWEWPSEFCDRVGMHIGSLSRILRAPDLPYVELNWGPNAGRGMRPRLWKIKSNEAFEQWLISRRKRCGLSTHEQL